MPTHAASSTCCCRRIPPAATSPLLPHPLLLWGAGPGHGRLSRARAHGPGQGLGGGTSEDQAAAERWGRDPQPLQVWKVRLQEQPQAPTLAQRNGGCCPHNASDKEEKWVTKSPPGLGAVPRGEQSKTCCNHRQDGITHLLCVDTATGFVEVIQQI